jgi:sugar lactone lactonase YvrE
MLMTKPEPWQTRLIGTLTGLTNPESAEMLDDGETIIFGNTTLMIGNPHHRGGKSLIYLKDKAFMSRARLSRDGELNVEVPQLVPGLTATLGTEVHRKGTSRLPPGTGLSACGGKPFATDGAAPLGTDDEARQQILAFDPSSGDILGRIALWEGSAVAKAVGHRVDMPNGVAVAPNGDLYIADNPNSNPESAMPPPVPACAYRIPFEAIDPLLDDDQAAAELVQAVEFEGWFNGIAASPLDNAAWAVSCSYSDPLKGAIFRIDEEHFATSTLPEPFVTGLGILDGCAVSRRGTVFASNPLTRDIHVFPTAGGHYVLRIDGEGIPATHPADINVVYPLYLGGEPALLVGDLNMGSPPGGAQILVLDIAQL